MRYVTITTGLCMLVMTCSSYASTYELLPEYSTGSGTNAATIVVDFGLSSYAFNYSWDGSATGWDALNAVDLNGSLDVMSIDYGSMGIYVYALLYGEAGVYDYGMGVTQGWAYYSSDDGVNWYLTSGVSFRELTNGSWDAFVWSNYDFSVSWDPIRQPGQVPIPEPATLMLLGFGGLLFRRRLV